MMLCIYYIEVMQLDCVHVIQVPSLSCVALQCDSSVKLLRLLSPPTQTSTFETASGSEIMARAEVLSFSLQKGSSLPLPSLPACCCRYFSCRVRAQGKKERKKEKPFLHNPLPQHWQQWHAAVCQHGLGFCPCCCWLHRWGCRWSWALPAGVTSPVRSGERSSELICIHRLQTSQWLVPKGTILFQQLISNIKSTAAYLCAFFA